MVDSGGPAGAEPARRALRTADTSLSARREFLPLTALRSPAHHRPRTTLRALSPDNASEVTYNARLLGFTSQGGPILQFAEMPRPFDAKSSAVLSTGRDGQVIISFTHDMSIRNTPDAPRAGPAAAASSARAPSTVGFHPDVAQRPPSEKEAQSPA